MDDADHVLCAERAGPDFVLPSELHDIQFGRDDSKRFREQGTRSVLSEIARLRKENKSLSSIYS